MENKQDEAESDQEEQQNQADGEASDQASNQNKHEVEDSENKSPANKLGALFAQKEDSFKISLDECYVELRLKFLNIMKSQFWEFFEDGLCNKETVVIL